MKVKIRYAFFILMLVLVAGCSGGDPQLIASHPLSTPIASYPDHPPVPLDPLVVYSATLELEVSNVERVSERAVSLIAEYGGYLVSSQSWFIQDRQHATLVLAVPAANFDFARRALLGLGSLVSEKVSGRLVESRYWQGTEYSHITLHLRPKDSMWPDLTLPNWRPARTFADAWGVFTAIFGFIVDVLIWVLVVGGPFALIGWALRVWIRRRRAA